MNWDVPISCCHPRPLAPTTHTGRRAALAGFLGYLVSEEARSRAYWLRVCAQAGLYGDGKDYARAAEAYRVAGYREGANLLAHIARARNKTTKKSVHVRVESDGTHHEDTRIVFNVPLAWNLPAVFHVESGIGDGP